MHAGMSVRVLSHADATHRVSAVGGAGFRRMHLASVREAGDLNGQTRTAVAVRSPSPTPCRLLTTSNECDQTRKYRDLYQKPSPFVLFGASAEPEGCRGREPPYDIARIVSNRPVIQISLGLSGVGLSPGRPDPKYQSGLAGIPNGEAGISRSP